jgi:hypothetical protein
LPFAGLVLEWKEGHAKEASIMALAGQVEDPQRIATEQITYPSDGTNIEAFTARPRQAGRYPGIIVIHEAFGVDDHIRDIAGRFANAGFIASARPHRATWAR